MFTSTHLHTGYEYTLYAKETDLTIYVTTTKHTKHGKT